MSSEQARIKSALAILGFTSIDEFEDYIVANGAVKLVPAEYSATNNETQLPVSPSKFQNQWNKRGQKLRESETENKQLKTDHQRLQKRLETTQEELNNTRKDLQTAYDHLRSKKLLSPTQVSRNPEEIDLLKSELGTLREENADLKQQLEDFRAAVIEELAQRETLLTETVAAKDVEIKRLQTLISAQSKPESKPENVFLSPRKAAVRQRRLDRYDTLKKTYSEYREKLQKNLDWLAGSISYSKQHPSITPHLPPSTADKLNQISLEEYPTTPYFDPHLSSDNVNQIYPDLVSLFQQLENRIRDFDTYKRVWEKARIQAGLVSPDKNGSARKTVRLKRTKSKTLTDVPSTSTYNDSMPLGHTTPKSPNKSSPNSNSRVEETPKRMQSQKFDLLSTYRSMKQTTDESSIFERNMARVLSSTHTQSSILEPDTVSEATSPFLGSEASTSSPLRASKTLASEIPKSASPKKIFGWQTQVSPNQSTAFKEEDFEIDSDNDIVPGSPSPSPTKRLKVVLDNTPRPLYKPQKPHPETTPTIPSLVKSLHRSTLSTAQKPTRKEFPNASEIDSESDPDFPPAKKVPPSSVLRERDTVTSTAKKRARGKVQMVPSLASPKRRRVAGREPLTTSLSLVDDSDDDENVEAETSTSAHKTKTRKNRYSDVHWENMDISASIEKGPDPESPKGKKWIEQIRKNRKAAALKIQEEKNKRKSLMRSASDFELNPELNDGEKHAFQEVVRDKARRQQMLGVTCDQCEEWFKRTGRRPGSCDHERVNENSRHRVLQRAEPTPPDYWQMGFPSTNHVQEINEEAEAIKTERYKYIEAEAELGSQGRYRRRSSRLFK